MGRTAFYQKTWLNGVVPVASLREVLYAHKAIGRIVCQAFWLS